MASELADQRGPGNDAEEEEVVETDPEGRYYRYGEIVGRGRFKQIYKAFDTQIGIDVAWSKIRAEPHHLSQGQLHEIVDEMTKGLELEHPNIIKCFKCWEDDGAGCINLITELFTSGNLRQYRNLHKHLDLKAVKRMARQILRGLEYLHTMDPPLMHGDLRCDKIYVNGHSGEIKIGDLGLATLIPLRWESAAAAAAGDGDDDAAAAAAAAGGAPPDGGGAVDRHDVRADIFAFGLCMLELLTLKQLDPQFAGDAAALLREVADGEAREFIAHCVGPAEERPAAAQLLDDPFLQVKKAAPAAASSAAAAGAAGAAAAAAGGAPSAAQAGGGNGGSGGGQPSGGSGAGGGSGGAADGGGAGGAGGGAEQQLAQPGEGGEDGEGEGHIAIGKLRGEDYNFEFHGKVRRGALMR